jgi:hypothetical protein
MRPQFHEAIHRCDLMQEPYNNDPLSDAFQRNHESVYRLQGEVMRMLLASLPVLGWLISVSLNLWLRSILNAAGATVLVPIISVSDRAGRDVVSDVTGFAVVVGWGLGCALLVEPTKAAVHSARRRVALYALLVGYQIVLFGDTIRAHAFDWWRWLLSLTGIATLPMFPTEQDAASFHFPWLSCALAVATAIAVFRSLANDNHEADVATTVP